MENVYNVPIDISGFKKVFVYSAFKLVYNCDAAQSVGFLFHVFITL